MRLSILHRLIFPLSAAASVFGDDLNARFSDFDWSDIEPSRNLEYHDCYDEYKCARLVLPLDWLNTTDPRTVTIAMMKLPATVPDDDPAFAGSVFTNPGGPGHSGVVFLSRQGRHLQATIDKPGKRHYEIVSFDPRGVGLSTPRSDCFRGNSLARDGVVLETRGTLGLDGGLESMAYNYALGEGIAQRCKSADAEEPIFEYLSTPSVARDMVEMIDKIDELRKKEAEDKGWSWPDLKKRSGKDADDVARLQYIGFSYGTLLGNFFASMFPGRVHRMILDSVCDADDYVKGPGWLKNLELMDATLDEFFKGCHEAGPDVCPLSRDSDGSWFDISQRVWSHIADLDEAPKGQVNAQGYNVVVRGKDIRDLVGFTVYNPVQTFRLLAQTLNQTMSGTYEPFVSLLTLFKAVPVLANDCSVADNKTVPDEDVGEGLVAVLCADGEDVSGKDFAYWRHYVSQLTSMSRVWGYRWADLRFACATWPFRAKWTFTGPFTSPEADSTPLAGRPSAPLLFLANRFDPVTPASSARAMAAQHPGARLVVQESMGHGVVPGAPSNCTDKIVADYFDSGVVPSEETTCEADCGPWDDYCEVSKASSGFFSTEYTESLGHMRRFPLGV